MYSCTALPHCKVVVVHPGQTPTDTHAGTPATHLGTPEKEIVNIAHAPVPPPPPNLHVAEFLQWCVGQRISQFTLNVQLMHLDRNTAVAFIHLLEDCFYNSAILLPRPSPSHTRLNIPA